MDEQALRGGMDEQALRALVRESVTRHLGTPGQPVESRPQSIARDASHYRYALQPRTLNFAWYVASGYSRTPGRLVASGFSRTSVTTRGVRLQPDLRDLRNLVESNP